MHTDPIADLLTRIRNGARAGHEEVLAPYSTVKENILAMMKKYKFIEQYKKEKGEKGENLRIWIKDDRRDLTIKRVSTPGQRIYVKKEELRSIKSGLGIKIISTSKGIITNVEAHKMNIGGEVICEIY